MFVRELEKLGFSFEKTQSWSFLLLVVVAIFACKRDIVKKHVYAGASYINFYETEFEHLNIYKSIFVKQNLHIWIFTNPFLWNGIWADLKGLHLLKLLRTRWMERRGDRFRNLQRLNILWWSLEIKKNRQIPHISSLENQSFFLVSLILFLPCKQLVNPWNWSYFLNPGFAEGGTDQGIGSLFNQQLFQPQHKNKYNITIKLTTKISN